MEPLWELFGSSWWLYAQMLFTLAMVVHVYRSGAEPFWYFVIFFLQPIGAWVYFFVVFLRNFRFTGGVSTGPLWQRKLSLDELRYHAERTPTVNNRIAFAQGLMAKGRHAEAIPILDGVLATDHIHCQAMHDLAICHLASGAAEQSVAMLKKLLERDYRWGYYRAWRTLIDAESACKRPEEALKACRELAKMVPTLENKCLLAEHLVDSGLKAEAIDVLDQALEDHAYTPWSKRLKNWHWARVANRLLREAETK